MPIDVNGETYYNVTESAKYLHVSKPTFYKNVQPRITEYRLGAFNRPYYRKSDLDKYLGVRPADDEDKENR